MVSYRLQTIAAAVAVLLLPGSSAKTGFTGDILDGYPVITSLDLADTKPNTITRYYFRTVQAQGTVYYDLPLIVARGTSESLQSGKKLSLSSSVHGDELNGIRVIQNVVKGLESPIARVKPMWSLLHGLHKVIKERAQFTVRLIWHWMHRSRPY